VICTGLGPFERKVDMKTRIFWIALWILAALVQSAEAQMTVDLYVYSDGFGTAAHTPLNPTIDLGDTVHWIWDASDHSTTSAAGQAESWNSGILSAGSTFDHTFTHLGTFNYYCMVHGFDAGNGTVGGMSGFITVVPEPQAWGAATGLLLLGLIAIRRRVWRNSGKL
jgi:plastocyanin